MLSDALNPTRKRPAWIGRFAPPPPTEIELVHYRQITDKYYVGGTELIVLKCRARSDAFEVTSHAFPSPGTPGEGREGGLRHGGQTPSPALPRRVQRGRGQSGKCSRAVAAIMSNYRSLTSVLSQRLALGCLVHASYIASAQ